MDLVPFKATALMRAEEGFFTPFSLRNCKMSAQAPLTNGAAMEVPDKGT